MANIGLRLDKEEYFPGEKIKGVLDIPESIKLNNFLLYVYGEEQTRIYQSTSGSTPGAAGGTKFSSKDLFLDQELSGYLSSLHGQTSGVHERPKEIKFEYTLPQNILESYNGKYVQISYGIIAQAERKWLPAINVKIPFRIKKESKVDDQSERVTKEEKNSNGIYLKIDLEKSVLASGKTMEGQLKIENPKGHKIRGVKMSLIGSERVTAEYKVHLSKRVDHTEKITPVEKYNMNVVWKGEIDLPFKIDLPKGMKKSYRGKFSEYFWILDTELNIAFARDLHLKTDIQII